MTGEHERYIEAVERLREKHADRFAELSWTDRRRARASQLQSIASKAGADPIARGQYVLKSLS